MRALWRADRGLATLWWAILVLRGLLPAAFAVAMGTLVGAVNADDPLGGPLTFMGVVFVLLQVLTPLHLAVGYNLGDRTAAWLYDELTDACIEPPGIGHLEDPELGNDLTVAREFDLGMTGPPLSISMDFIAGSLVEMVGRPGVGRRAVRLRLVGAARARRRLAGHPLAAAGERRVARSQHRRGAQRAARRRLRLPAGRRSARRQGAAPVRAGRLDGRPVHRPAHHAPPPPVRGDPAAREVGGVEPRPGADRQRHRVLGDDRRHPRRAARAQPDDHLRPGRRRRVAHRVRRA